MEITRKARGSAALMVAANNASATTKGRADYVCDGTADDVEIQKAIDALPSGGGKVVLSEGLFDITASITLSSDQALEGQGQRATDLYTTTSSLDVLQIHGANVSSKIQGVYIGNLKVRSNVSATSDGISLRYSNRNIFENIEIVGFNGHGLHIAGSHDNRWLNIYVNDCGHTSSSLPAVFLQNLSDQDVNSEHFRVLHVEPWRYEAIEIGPVVNSKVAHFNWFIDTKIHGDNSAPGIVVKGERNTFFGLQLSVMAGYTAVEIIGSVEDNQFYSIVPGAVALLFDIAGSYNIVSGITGDGGGSKVIDDGFNISGNGNHISGVNLRNMHGWVFTVSGDRNKISHVELTTIDEEGFIISGDDNILVSCSPNWVGIDSGDAIAITGDTNQIFGGKCGGSGGKTIDLASGADNNRVYGMEVDNPVTDAGAGNEFHGMLGYTPSGSIKTITKVIDHADIVDDSGASGHADFAETIPAGSIIKAVKLDFTEAFNSDATSALKVMVGPQSDLDDFSKTVSPGDEAFNTTTDDFWGESACQDPVVVAAAAPRITFTEDGTGDITDIISGGNAQGAMTITITYMKA